MLAQVPAISVLLPKAPDLNALEADLRAVVTHGVKNGHANGKDNGHATGLLPSAESGICADGCAA
jgi:hypothetical protein